MARSYGRLALNRRVMVNLTTGSAIQGVLWQDRGRVLVLKDAALHLDGGTQAPIDGEALIDRDRVEFVQVLP